MRAFFIFLLVTSILTLSLEGQAQRYTVSGTIINKNSGKGNKHAAIVETLSKTGTISSDDGYFRLLLKEGEKVIEFSSPGFLPVTVEFELKADTTLQIEMVPLSESVKTNQPDVSIPPDSVIIADSKKIKLKKDEK